MDGIDFGDDLTRLDHGIEIDRKLLDVTGDLAADLHIEDGIERAGSCDGLGNGTPGDRAGLYSPAPLPLQRRKAKTAKTRIRIRKKSKKDESFHQKSRRPCADSYCLDRSDGN